MPARHTMTDHAITRCFVSRSPNLRHTTTLRRTTLRTIFGAALLGLASAVGAQAGTGTSTGTWPDKPIRFVVAGPAGGGNDIFTRMIANVVQASLKQTVIVENKPGANGLIGNDAVAKSPKDGSTFLFTPSSSIAINPIVQAKMPYDTQKDLVPVAQIGAGGILLMSNPASGLKNLQDMVSWAKANPGKLSYGTWGNGSTGHLVMEGIKAHYGLRCSTWPTRARRPR